MNAQAMSRLLMEPQIASSELFQWANDRAAFTLAGQALLAGLHPLPKGIRLLGLGLNNLGQEPASEAVQLGLAI